MEDLKIKLSPPTIEKQSDDEIIALILNQGQREHFGILYKRYAAKVYAQCFYYLNDEHLAEDFTQDIFIKVMNKLDTFAGNASFRTWLSTIARNFCLDYKRKTKNYRIIWVDDFGDNGQYALFEGPKEFETDEGAISQMKVFRIISEIKQEERNIIEMKYFEGKSIIEIKEYLNLSTQSATKMRLKRTRDKIRKRYFAKTS